LRSSAGIPLHPRPSGSRQRRISAARKIPEKKHALSARPSSAFKRAIYLLASDLHLGSIDGCRSRRRRRTRLAASPFQAVFSAVVIRNRYCDSVSIG
jgi:hypothetical protein